jgi:uncharacterized membrane protein
MLTYLHPFVLFVCVIKCYTNWYLRYLCLFCVYWCPAHNVVSFSFVFLRLIIAYVPSFSGLSIFDWPFGFI